jgi:hypothetical protein
LQRNFCNLQEREELNRKNLGIALCIQADACASLVRHCACQPSRAGTTKHGLYSRLGLPANLAKGPASVRPVMANGLEWPRRPINGLFGLDLGRPCRPWQPKALSAWLVAQGRDWLRGLGGLQLGVLHTTGAAALVAGPCATRARQHDPFFFNAGARRRGSGEVGGGGANPPWGFSKFPAHGGSSRARSDRWPIPHRGGQTWQGAETPLVAGGSAGMGHRLPPPSGSVTLTSVHGRLTARARVDGPTAAQVLPAERRLVERRAHNQFGGRLDGRRA